MANIQKYLEEFHDKIRIDYETNATLREKRDIILERIRKYLKDNKLPTFDELMQGSYAFGTGTIPVNEVEFDIDVGLCFKIAENDYTPKQIHDWIFMAVDGHTEKVEDRGPCIRVTYADGYHVDLVPYARWDDMNKVTHYRLGHRDKGWRPADPVGLLDYVKKARISFSGTEDDKTKTDQFRRCVRYFRRWYDIQVQGQSRSKPTGLAFLLMTATGLQPTRLFDGKPDDRGALNKMAARYGQTVGRITAFKPTPEHEDILTRLTDDDIDNLKRRFRELAAGLLAADQETDPVEACKILRRYFGPDFPIPSPEDTGKKTKAPAVVTSSSSA